MKTLTRRQLESRKAQAVRFARDVREDDELADEIENESVTEYAERRRINIENPRKGKAMPIPTRRELTEKIEELETENEELKSRLEEIGDLASTEEEEEDEEGE